MPDQLPEPRGVQVERELYATLLAALEDGLVRSMENPLRVVQQASQPLGPRGMERLAQQERQLDRDRTIDEWRPPTRRGRHPDVRIRDRPRDGG